MRVATAALIFFVMELININGSIAEARDGEVNFIRNDRVLTWRTNNSGRFNLSKNINLNLNSNLSSSLNLATGYGLKDRWYDSVYNTAELGYAFSDKMEIGFTAREDWNRDTLSRFGKSLLTTTFDGSVKYRPFDSFNLAAGVGQMYDRRFENEDKGTNINGEIQYRVSPSKNLYTSIDITAATSNLDRSNDLFHIESKVEYDHNLVKILMGFDENRRVRGYFSDVDRREIKERERIEKNLFFVLSRGSFNNYRNSTAFEISMNLGDKRVEDSANDNKLSSKYKNNSKGNIKDFGVRLARGIGKRILTRWEAGYLRDANNVQRRIRSRTQTDISMRGEVGIGIGSSDSVSIIGWIKRSRFDTPIGVVNDRDELKFESGIKYSRKFYNNLETGLDFRVLETHYVNIDASQSIQNKFP